MSELINYQPGDLDTQPMAKQKEILMDQFGVIPDEKDKLYVGLLDSGSQKIEITKEVKQGLKFRHLTKTKVRKIYLTP